MSLATFSTFASMFAPSPRLYFHRLDEVDEPPVQRGRRYWVLSRGLCRFVKIPLLVDVSTARQLEALRLQIERVSPFAETGSHVHFGDDAIAVWLWDQGVVRDAADAIGVDLRRVSVIPETAMQPQGEGVRLVECLDGVEGQCWDNASLAASRWWPSIPDSRGWVLFQRGASVPPDRIAVEPPPPAALPWLGRRWTESPAGGWNGIASIDLRMVAACIAAAFLMGYGYLGAEWLRLVWNISAIERQVAAYSADIAPITHARATAMDDAATIRRLYELDPYPSQLALMAQVANMLPKNETHLAGWSYDRGQLEITVAADHPLDATFFVRTLERIDRFNGVSAERAGGDNSLRIRLTIKPL
jgi:hypothetical protein